MSVNIKCGVADKEHACSASLVEVKTERKTEAAADKASYSSGFLQKQSETF